MSGSHRKTLGPSLAILVLAAQTLFWKSALALAQDPKIQVEINTPARHGPAWYNVWWVWVLIGLFVLIIVIALTSRGRTQA